MCSTSLQRLSPDRGSSEPRSGPPAASVLSVAAQILWPHLRSVPISIAIPGSYARHAARSARPTPSPLRAANATFALHRPVWFLLVRFICSAPGAHIVLPHLSRNSTCRRYEFPAPSLSGVKQAKKPAFKFPTMPKEYGYRKKVVCRKTVLRSNPVRIAVLQRNTTDRHDRSCGLGSILPRRTLRT